MIAVKCTVGVINMSLSSRFNRILSGPLEAEKDAAEALLYDAERGQERKAVITVKRACPFLKGT